MRVDAPAPSAPPKPEKEEAEVPATGGSTPGPVIVQSPADDVDTGGKDAPAVVQGSDRDTPVTPRPADEPPVAARPLPSLPAIIKSVFGGQETPAPPPAETASSEPDGTRKKGGRDRVVDTSTPIDPAVAEPPRARQQTVRVAEDREPAAAATAPRITLSAGGDRAQTYRQYEIAALGLTPRSRQVVGALGFRVLSEQRSALLGGRTVARLRTPANQTAEASLRRLRATLPDVTFDFAHLYRPSGDQAPVRYAANMIGAPAGGSCRIETRVGLIDSGIAEHPALAGARIVRKNFVEQGAATNVAHGTAVASILVGELPGSGALMPGAQLYSANVFVQDRSGLRADATAIIAALDWMAAQNVKVVNLSLMGPANALLDQAVAAAASRGLVMVAAAGNDGPGAGPAYPAAYPAVIAVSAVDARGRPYGRNNRGGYIYVAAPGVDIWGADARGGVAFWTGTSFAAPFVTATVARDLAQGRARNINDGRARLAASARDLGAPGRDPIYGFGLLQVGGCQGTSPPGVLSSKN